MASISPITMPKFGLAMTEGKIASWTVPEGGQVNAGDELADIETTKITSAYESPVSGVLRRHVAREQEELPVGALIGVVAPASVPDREIEAFITHFRAEFADLQAQATIEPVPEPKTISAGGRVIRYLPAGPSGRPAIVFIHGFGGDLNNWLFNQPLLSADHPTYALDLPGHGGSEKKVGAGDVESLAGALTAFMGALDISHAHLVGHSLGGAVALHAALHHSALVSALSLICPTGLGHEINADFIDGFLRAERRKQFQSVLEQLFADPGLVSRDMIEGLLRFKRLDGAVAALRTIAAANFANGRQLSALRDQLAQLPIPVQVIWGAQDRIIPARHAEGLPASVGVHVLPAAGHMPHMESAGEVNRLLARLMASDRAI